MIDDRKSDAPFYLLVGESKLGMFNLRDLTPETFDDVEAATAQATHDNDKWGTGEVVFECKPVFHLVTDETRDYEAVLVEPINPSDPLIEEVIALTAGPAPQADDPESDNTDAAHPAWWRGVNHGCHATVSAVNQVLDTLERAEPYGHYFAGEELEALKHRLELLLLKKEAA